jgi:hypothetical protein
MRDELLDQLEARKFKFELNVYRKKAEKWMDIYGLAFQAMHRSSGKELKAQARDRAVAFENSFLVFIMQWALLGIVIHIMVGHYNFDILRPKSIPITIIRFIAGIMMHMNVEFKIRQSLNMMKFVSLHEHEFDRPGFAFFVGFMQFMTTAGIEMLCAYFMSSLNTIIVCFVKYLAFG